VPTIIKDIKTPAIKKAIKASSMPRDFNIVTNIHTNGVAINAHPVSFLMRHHAVELGHLDKLA